MSPQKCFPGSDGVLGWEMCNFWMGIGSCFIKIVITDNLIVLDGIYFRMWQTNIEETVEGNVIRLRR